MMGFSYIGSFSVIAPILSIYLKDVIGTQVETIGLITAMFFVTSALTKLLLGVFAGGKKTITFLFFAFMIFAICPAFYPLTDSIVALVVLRVAQGFAYAFIGTASLILAALAISHLERDKGVSTYTASLSLGLLAGPAITTLSIPVFGISNTFYLATIVGFIGIFASFFLHTKLSAIERDWQIVGVTFEKESTRSKISTVARNHMFGIAFIGNLAFFILFGVLLVYGPLYAKERLDFSDELVSALFLLYYIATTITRFSTGKIVQKVGKPTLMMAGTLLAGLLALTLRIVANDLFFAVIFASIGAIQGVLFPVGSLLIAQYIKPSRNVFANSLYLMAVDVGQGIAPLITAGVVVQHGLESSFIVAGIISALAALLLILLSMYKST